ncbi:MAG: aminoglycoside phosphotransferase family protein [Candidatus Promineifilaceae bacterium]|nr:aminoglycoside phosphotransferase family protein [Candidatus Promineifilaceae bacterium]
MMNLPLHFQETILTAFGEDGLIWLNQLPQLIKYCRQRWSLTVAPHFSDLSYNYVAPATRTNGTEVVLKLGVPRLELRTEAAALSYYDGRGSVRLLDAELDRGILILERLQPGIMLSTLWPDEDDRATRIAAEIMRQLWQPIPADHTFVTVEDWYLGFERLRHEFSAGSGPFPPTLVDRAESLYAHLQESMDTPVLLHGDLHHYNILSTADHSWTAIDPKGVVGEAAYDTGALLRNPAPHFLAQTDLTPRLKRRIDILSEMLDLDRERLVSWGMSQAVLSAWWSYEDHGAGWEPAIHLAQTLTELL